jgi:hypothetical protein
MLGKQEDRRGNTARAESLGSYSRLISCAVRFAIVTDLVHVRERFANQGL